MRSKINSEDIQTTSKNEQFTSLTNGDLTTSDSSLRSRSQRISPLKPLTEEEEEEEEEDTRSIKSPSHQSTRSHLSRSHEGKRPVNQSRSSSQQTRSPDKQKPCPLDRKPQIDDDDVDTDLDEEQAEDVSLREMKARMYKDSCTQMGVVPASYYVRHMDDEQVSLKHHGLGPMGARALAVSLCSNTSITCLDLSHNDIGPQGAHALVEMLKDNLFITELDISDNDIGSEGLQEFSDMLSNNKTIRSLNLSANGLKDRDAETVAKFILENNYLKRLNLSHNEFSESGGAVLGAAIGENEVLEQLDLSWNHLRRGGSISVLDGIQNSALLKSANLAFNGLGTEGATAVSNLLKNNQVIRHLDISNNRIGTEGVAIIAKGLFTNETLKVFRMGHNPISSESTITLLQSINNERSAMECLDLSSIAVEIEFMNLKQQLLEPRPHLLVIHGQVLGEEDRLSQKIRAMTEEEQALKELGKLQDSHEEEFLQSDPVALLRTYVNQKNLRLLDLFHMIDRDKNYRISKDEFLLGLKNIGVELSDHQIDVLMTKIEMPDTGTVDYRKFAVGDKTTKDQRRLRAKIDLEVRRMSTSVGTSMPSLDEVLELRRLAESIRD